MVDPEHTTRPSLDAGRHRTQYKQKQKRQIKYRSLLFGGREHAKRRDESVPTRSKRRCRHAAKREPDDEEVDDTRVGSLFTQTGVRFVYACTCANCIHRKCYLFVSVECVVFCWRCATNRLYSQQFDGGLSMYVCLCAISTRAANLPTAAG